MLYLRELFFNATHVAVYVTSFSWWWPRSFKICFKF